MSNKSLRESFGLRFSMIARRWQRALEGHLASVGMTDATWRPLVHLKESGGGISQKDLSIRVGVDTSSLVRVLDILERDGLLERRRDERDGRANLIYLTKAGELREREIRKALHDAEGVVLARLFDQDIERALVSLEALNHGLSDLEQALGRETSTPKPRRRGEVA